MHRRETDYSAFTVAVLIIVLASFFGSLLSVSLAMVLWGAFS